MKTSSKSPHLGSIRAAVIFSAILLFALRSFASPSVVYTAPILTTTANSSATSSGNYVLTVTYGFTPTINLTWTASGQSAVEPSSSGSSFPGQTDLPGFGFDVFDVTTNTDLANAYLPTSGQSGLYGTAILFTPPSASGGTFWLSNN